MGQGFKKGFTGHTLKDMWRWDRQESTDTWAGVGGGGQETAIPWNVLPNTAQKHHSNFLE